MKNLFDLIKNQEYDKIIKILKEDSDIEINIQDNFNNYFIEYVLDTGNIKLIKAVLSKDVLLDIIDTNGTTLLYNTIKLNKIEILKLLIESSNNTIGINIIDKKDIRGRTPLHYCIIFNNMDAFHLILDNNGDPYIPNKDGLNIFFYCLKYNRNKMLLYLFEKYSKFNIKNNNGENLLQSAISYSNDEIINYLLDNTSINLNNQTTEYGTNALHLLTVTNKTELVKKIIKLGADITISDFIGNNLLHYSIEEQNDELINYYLELNKINLNLTNLEGNTPLHMYLIEHKNINKKILEILINNSNLNIQNHKGDTVLHLLIRLNLIDRFTDILVKKPLNIFIQNYNGKSIYDLYNDKNKLLILISESYYNNLITKKLTVDWEIKCSLIKDNKLTEYTGKVDLNKLDKLKNRNDCINKIKDVILKENRSIPKNNNNINFDFDSGMVIDDCFFSGFPIDTLFGLVWLKKMYPQISLILDYPLSSNDNVIEYYNKMGIDFNYKLEFINIMILWVNQKIFFPEYFDVVVQKNIKEGTNIIIIPIGIETALGAHTNILFWDVKKNIIERFEPNGKNPPLGFDYNPKLLDIFILQKIKTFSENITYLKPTDYLPTIGFQVIENLDNERCKKIGDPNGFCTVWCIWYCYQKLLNLEIPSKKLVEQLINNIKFEAKSFKIVIRNFSKNISNLRDQYLKKININIHDWVLTNYTEEDINKLEKIILKKLY